LAKPPDITTLLENLVSLAYPELRQASIDISWGKTSSFAQIQWDKSINNVSIRINKNVKSWHDAGITGLISHELSHPMQKGRKPSELKTDGDAISRGLGPYLAVERLFAGKYDDHVISSGRDRYLGYRSIRIQLTKLEAQQLDLLLSGIGLAPVNTPSLIQSSHDTIIFDNERRTILTIEGHQFILLTPTINPDVKLAERNHVTFVYVDETLVGQFSLEEGRYSSRTL
jgi:hypothetical protein